MNIATDINDKELLATLENSINAADSYAESEIGEQRNKGHRYYYGKPLGMREQGAHSTFRWMFLMLLRASKL